MNPILSINVIIIADKRIPEAAKTRLETYAQVLYLETSGITYPAVSGHPDIFFCQTRDGLVCAANAPVEIVNQLVAAGISVIKGKRPIGSKYPDTAVLNAVATDKHLVHNLNYTDPILKISCSHLTAVHLNQAYTRCNLIPLADERFITSDSGIEKVLKQHGFETLYVSPEGILLPGHDHGFIGGSCGVKGKMIFFIGNLNHFPESQKIRTFLKSYDIIELYDGPLFDGGSIIFLEPSSPLS